MYLRVCVISEKVATFCRMQILKNSGTSLNDLRELWQALYLCFKLISPLRLRSLLDQQPRTRIRIQELVGIQIRRTSLSLRILELVLQQQMGDNYLELGGGKEPAGTGVLAAAEMHVVLIRRRILVLVLLRGCFPQLVIPEPIERLCVG